MVLVLGVEGQSGEQRRADLAGHTFHGDAAEMHIQTDQTDRPTCTGHAVKMASRDGSGGSIRSGESPDISPIKMDPHQCMKALQSRPEQELKSVLVLGVGGKNVEGHR